MPAQRDLRQLLFWLPVLVSFRLFASYSRGIYQLVWRFVSLADALKIAKSIAIVTLGLLALRLLVPEHRVITYWIKLPLSIIALEGLLSLTGSLTIRALRRIQYSRQKRSAVVNGRIPRRVLLYGACRAGILLSKELEANRDYDVVGFIDDDRQKVGSTISGTRVLGNGENLPTLAAKYKIEEVVISMATASRQTLARILAGCRRAGLSAKVIPSLREILDEKVPISRLRETQVEDVLGRDRVEVPSLDATVGSTYRGKRILVTGAGGSIGSELVRQLVRLGPARIAILDKDENSIYELEQELLLRRARFTPNRKSPTCVTKAACAPSSRTSSHKLCSMRRPISMFR